MSLNKAFDTGVEVVDDSNEVRPSASNQADERSDDQLLPDLLTYRVYRRRWAGLAQLILLNIVISWSWLSFAPVSNLAAEWFGVSQSAINWASTAFLLAFFAASPITLILLNKSGPALSIRTASVLVLIGSWVRYAGSQRGIFGVAMFGQIIIGIAQPFVLSAPTRYSNLWFSDRGRVSATAIASLANPFGGALGQLISPFWANDASQIPSMILWTSIISTVVAIGGVVTPKKPPTPPSASAITEAYDIKDALHRLPRDTVFWLIAIPFVVYIGFFNATSSLLNQMLEPYGFGDEDAGIAGAILILVGLAAAAITSPIIDRTKLFLPAIWILVPFVGASYIALIFMPQTRSIPGPYVVCAILGASSFSLLPCALEYMSLVTRPVSPEISSTICWSASQLLGAIFIIIMDALGASATASPPYNLYWSLVFQAVIACAVLPLPFAITWAQNRSRRTRSFEHGNDSVHL